MWKLFNNTLNNNKKYSVHQFVKKESLDKTKLEGENHFTLKLGIDAGKDFDSPEKKKKKEFSSWVSFNFDDDYLVKLKVVSE